MFRLIAARRRFHPEAESASLIMLFSVWCLRSLTTFFIPTRGVPAVSACKWAAPSPNLLRPNAGLAFGQAPALETGEAPTLNDHEVGDDWQLVSGDKFIKMSGARNRVPTPSAFVRTEIQKRIGGYRPRPRHSLPIWCRNLRLRSGDRCNGQDALQASDGSGRLAVLARPYRQDPSDGYA